MGNGHRKALIFDMDGVLVDSNPMHVEAWTEYNRRFGLPMDGAMQQRMFGKRNDELVRDFFGDGLPEEEVFAHGARKEALYREMMKGRLAESLVPGVREFLTQRHAMPKGVGTNAEPLNVEFILEEAGLRQFFQAVVDGHQVRNAKPHPEVYLRVADLLQSDPQDCIVFEDSPAGVQAGLAAGMQVVGIGTTYRELPGVALLIDNFLDKRLDSWLSIHAN